ncbi:hypothetical protein L227DRAFT_572330 [Lentinus tigrinus ALCF2SS1-6]|uniref:Uncharacterized protein n=1 Tax=Lentinus tigrinus ALCF2SS1-6 TaxID=1328759 RepID=A0A5C2SKS1_9APHY|nr:hypothetical protein L227DRAFT_572330 [Lentinus tigrinus ALCF2SS1-6]
MRTGAGFPLLGSMSPARSKATLASTKEFQIFRQPYNWGSPIVTTICNPDRARMVLYQWACSQVGAILSGFVDTLSHPN